MVNKILKISAAWCGPCRQLKKELDDWDGDVPILDFDADENEKLCNDFKVKSIPTIIILDENDNEIGRKIGMITKLELQNYINTLNG